MRYHRMAMKVMVTLALLGVVNGCGNDLCSYTKPCPNDQPTADQIRIYESSCQSEVRSFAGQPCEGAEKNYLSCVKDAVVCSSAGTYDQQASMDKATKDCASAAQAVQDCYKPK